MDGRDEDESRRRLVVRRTITIERKPYEPTGGRFAFYKRYLGYTGSFVAVGGIIIAITGNVPFGLLGIIFGLLFMRRAYSDEKKAVERAARGVTGDADLRAAPPGHDY